MWSPYPHGKPGAPTNEREVFELRAARPTRNEHGQWSNGTRNGVDNCTEDCVGRCRGCS